MENGGGELWDLEVEVEGEEWVVVWVRSNVGEDYDFGFFK